MIWLILFLFMMFYVIRTAIDHYEAEKRYKEMQWMLAEESNEIELRMREFNERLPKWTK